MMGRPFVCPVFLMVAFFELALSMLTTRLCGKLR
jgi:hypothetical protein